MRWELVTALLLFLFWTPRRRRPSPPRWTSPQQVNENLRLDELSLVGTHNSASCKFLDSPHTALGAFRPVSTTVDILQFLRRWSSGCDRLLSNWCWTQEYSAGEQLARGVRALDLRVSTVKTPHGEEFVYSHLLANDFAVNVLHEIAQFLRQNPRVFIVIVSKPDIRHHQGEIGHDYFHMVEQVLGRHRLLPLQPNDGALCSRLAPRIGDVLDAGYQVMFISQGNAPWIWPIETTLSGSWAGAHDDESVVLEMYKNQTALAAPEMLRQV
jgi:hypothetical protein